MRYLGIDSSDLTRLGGIHTATEISQQPVIWQKIWEKILFDEAPIRSFLNTALANAGRIILTGAGTSAFIGISLRGVFQRSTGVPTETIPTTDIVTHPEDFFHAKIPTLLISFARSGNSPESVAALELADEICEQCYHLVITCNAQGQLANYSSSSEKYVFTLPKEANDQSLAMTSSYSGMLLAGLLMARINNLQDYHGSVQTIIQYAHKIIDFYAGDLKDIAQVDFKRAFFLGAGSFFGTATESQLKLQEFTDGKVICKSDSYLAFRHGPKVVIDNTTLVVYFLSSNGHAYQYEKDLIDSARTGAIPVLEMCIAETQPAKPHFQYAFHLSDNGTKTEDEFLSVCYIIPAQILGFFKSLQAGLQPDAPSASGAITRVVEGVQIHEME